MPQERKVLNPKMKRDTAYIIPPMVLSRHLEKRVLKRRDIVSYYTERHGMRNPIEKTYIITLDMYAMLFDCCEKYYNNIAWKYPEECADGYGCCGLDWTKFNTALKFEIPSLYRNSNGYIEKPSKNWRGELEEYDQYALLDYIEFMAQNCKDVEVGSFHSYFGHHHLQCKQTRWICTAFKSEINDIFTKTGLLYKLTDDKIIERIVENSPLTPDIETSISQVQERGVRELLQEAIALYKQPYPGSCRNAVEKIWDALERLKTYYTTMDKKASASQIVNDIADGQANFVELFDEEFKALTKIGNNYRIRHHETDKIDITDDRHFDYFFNRCLSLISLAIHYLK